MPANAGLATANFLNRTPKAVQAKHLKYQRADDDRPAHDRERIEVGPDQGRQNRLRFREA